MFLPLSAGKRVYPGFPWATFCLVALNAAVYGLEMWLRYGVGREALADLIGMWGFTPAAVAAGSGGRAFTAFTALFLHGGLGHVFFNLIFLAVFGPPLEELMGGMRFTLFYVLCGLMGSALTLFMDPASPRPHIGASGAVAGALGAFLLLFPRRRIQTLILAFIPMRLPAWLLLGGWLLNQLLLGQAVLDAGVNFSRIAVWSHLGGFAAGLALAGLFLRPDVVFNRRPAV